MHSAKANWLGPSFAGELLLGKRASSIDVEMRLLGLGRVLVRVAESNTLPVMTTTWSQPIMQIYTALQLGLPDSATCPCTPYRLGTPHAQANTHTKNLLAECKPQTLHPEPVVALIAKQSLNSGKYICTVQNGPSFAKMLWLVRRSILGCVSVDWDKDLVCVAKSNTPCCYDNHMEPGHHASKQRYKLSFLDQDKVPLRTS